MHLLFVLFTLLAALSVQADEDRYAKICMSGDVAGKGSCPSQPKPGKQPGEWGCTLDNKTGLVWSLESGKGTWTYAHDDFVKSANMESRCGHSSGWRLPTRSELMTLLIKENGTLEKMRALWEFNVSGNPAIDIRYFPETRADVYWTADILAPDPCFALFVYFKRGFDNEGNAYADSKSEDNYIRLVHDSR